MTISRRRWAKAHKKTMVPIADSIASWNDVGPDTAPDSNWVASDADAVLFGRDPARIGADLRAIWAGTGRASLEPLADVAQDIAARLAAEPLDDGGGELSADVYAMH